MAQRAAVLRSAMFLYASSTRAGRKAADGLPHAAAYATHLSHPCEQLQSYRLTKPNR